MLKGNLVKTVTSDGLEHAGFWMDATSEIAVFHSHGTSGDFYSHKFIEVEAEKLSAQGISFLTANNRGHDVYADIRKPVGKNVEWTQIGGGFERFEDCVLDIGAWVDFLTEHGVKKVILQSHSLTSKILYYQHKKHDPRVIGQILLSSQNDAGLMFYALGKEKYEKTNREIVKIVRDGKGSTLLPKELSPVSYQTSALMYLGYLTEEGPGTLTPYHSPDSPQWQVLEETREPLLVVYGGADNYMKPSVDVAVDLIKRYAKSTKKLTVKVIEGASHSYIGYENMLVDTILDWIKSNCV
ncbi:lysophospholipase [Patescibacteria group bacterium]|nr:lysophospholipase [Patescibacteria group bacterium]